MAEGARAGNFTGTGFLPVLVLLLQMAFLAAEARAHRLVVFAYPEGDTVHTESRFVPDTPVRQGKVRVLSVQSQRELLQGSTDDRGKFSFRLPPEALTEKPDLKIVVEAAMGHRGEWLLKADQYLPGLEKAAAPPAGAAPGPAATPEAAAKGQGVEPDKLAALLDQVLERRLAPIREQLAELNLRRITLADIIGGLGWILGLFGLWAYLRGAGGRHP